MLHFMPVVPTFGMLASAFLLLQLHGGSTAKDRGLAGGRPDHLFFYSCKHSFMRPDFLHRVNAWRCRTENLGRVA